MTKGPIYSSPTVYDGVVYFGSLDGRLYALNISDGSLLWKQNGVKTKKGKGSWDDKKVVHPQPEVANSPAISYGLVFVCINRKIHGFDLKTGKKVYKNPGSTSTRFLGSLTLAHGQYAQTHGDCGFGGWRIRNGEKSYAIGSAGNDTQHSTGAVWGDKSYFVGILGNIYCGDFTKNKKLWVSLSGGTAGRTETGNKNSKYPEFRVSVSSPGTNGNMLVVGLMSGISGTDVNAKDKRVSTVGNATTREKWFVKTGCKVESSPSIAGDVVYVGDSKGVFRALDINTGEEKWKFETGGGIISSAYVADGAVYFGSDDGYVYALK